MNTVMSAILIALSVILPPCETEDAQNCVWEAHQVGNGEGISFVDIGGTAFLLQN